LIPIAAVYFVAHYFTYIATIGQRAIRLASDPLDRGWNLFGTAGYEPTSFLRPAWVWVTQVALIVLGHAVAVLLSHEVAVENTKGRGASVRALLPGAAVAVAYTFAGLWVLAEGIAGD
jgi:hypothetical protein